MPNRRGNNRQVARRRNRGALGVRGGGINGRTLVQTTLGAVRAGRRIGSTVAKYFKRWKDYTRRKQKMRSSGGYGKIYSLPHHNGTFGHMKFRGHVQKDTWRQMKQLAEHRHYTNGYGRIFDSSTGNQAVGELALLDGNTLWNIVNDYIPSQATASTASHTARPYLTHWKTKITFSNMHTMSSRFRMYIVVPRHDYAGSSGTGTTPWGSWRLGLNDELGSGANDRTIFYESSPMRSKKFNKEWKLLKTYNFDMAPGAEHTHTFKLKGIKLLDPYWLQRYNLGSGFAVPGSKKNMTVWMLITVNGQVVWDNTNSRATTGNSNMTFVVSHEYGMKWLNAGLTDINMTDLLSHVTAENTKVVEEEAAAIYAPTQP